MTWWRWALVGLVVAGVVLALGFRWGVLTQRKDDADARLILRESADSAEKVHADTLAALASGVARATDRAAVAENRAAVAEAARQSGANDVLAAREALNTAQTTADSLAAYPPIVDALTRQLAATDSARVSYRDALAASHERAALLVRRIAADSTLIESQRATIAGMTPPPPKRDGWVCAAGATIAGGIRSGAGIGITCGRRLG